MEIEVKPGKTVKLSVDQARELYLQLHKVFAKPARLGWDDVPFAPPLRPWGIPEPIVTY
jgi:hypothetical protein